MKNWARLSDAELLSLRFRDLHLQPGGDLLTKAIRSLHRDLARKGLGFRPHIWLSDEWFCPDGVPGFAIPFYLAHPRLRRLERNIMLEVEGGTLRSCVRLMRHETGHAIDNAYRLRRRRRRRKLFGPPETEYPDFYSPKPFSRKYVRHLGSGYAQSHPDEDFAETFAVWLDPRSRWRRRYAGWPALDKLHYMDEVMKEISSQKPEIKNQRTPDSLSRLNRTLRKHYRRRRERYEVDFAEHYDDDLDRIFGEKGKVPAAKFLQRHRRFLRRHVAEWTGIRRYTVDQVLKDWIARARARNLAVSGSEEEAARNAATALTVRVMQYLQSGHYQVVL